MRIAYIIATHKCSEQIMLLIKQLNYKDNDIYIHVDGKNQVLYDKITKEIKDLKNISLIRNRINVNWSGFSIVQATINSMKEIKGTNKKYDYISLISGQDFPIKKNEYISDYLEMNKGKEFIEYRKLDDCDLFRLKTYNLFREYKNIRKLHMRVLDNILRRIQKVTIKRNNFKGLNLYHESAWFTITQECMEYILNYIETNPNYIRDFKYTLCPDEHFFQMIILNSRYKSNVKNDNLRYIDWRRPANSPRTLDITDLDKLKSTPKLIARKFDIETDNNIVTELIININEN